MYVGFDMFDRGDRSREDAELAIRHMEQSMSAIMVKRLAYGLWVAAQGLVWPSYDKAVGSAPDESRVVRWKVSADYGPAGITHCMLWGMVDGVWWGFDEWRHDGHEDGQLTAGAQAVQAMRALKVAARRVRTWVVDQSALDFIAAIEMAHRDQGLDVVVQRSEGEELPGVQLVDTWMYTGRLRVSGYCREWIKEAANYMWDQEAEKRGITRPQDHHNHGMDATRYMVWSEGGRPGLTNVGAQVSAEDIEVLREQMLFEVSRGGTLSR